MTLRLNGSTSGYVEIDAPATAGSNTLVLPTGNGSADQALVTNGSGTLSFADRGRIVQGTAQASTSGTSIDFTGIPSWAKRVTVMFKGVSTNGTGLIQVQMGTSSGVETTSYESYTSFISSSPAASAGGYTSGFVLYSSSASGARSGMMQLATLGSNAWVSSHTLGVVDGATAITIHGGGHKTLSGTLDRIRITTVSGTDAFDAGTINILYEG